ncbi:MAG: family 10 glycosylhydrolase [Pyrinomonadaceae bacterium]|nr:family 10 glycosylhydrolase [Pyrinomonadaceae bacterium]MBP6212870.1 family 10 glycosylhydrolase [Pyrinomonadaceae bacterium]
MKLVLLIMLFAVCALAQPMPPIVREFRAVWVATVDNIDFPTSKGLSAEKQKAELTAILDLAQKLRLNAVVFQVRPMTDAVYRSNLEPWSEFLTGQMGKAQDFDPLEFLVAEAHRRGILVHAWFNPYRAYHPAAKTMSDEHVSKTQPSIVRQYGRYMWLDPTDEAAKRHSLNVIKDVVRRYDIDGVHFDDYFYPYAEKDAAGSRIEFPDDANWAEYLKTGAEMSRASGVNRRPLSRDDWRRWHVNNFIESVGREIKRIKPDVVYGISPFGIWQPMPELGITGFNAYKELYADARKWLRDGTVDYLAPQLYWETARKGQSFPVLLDWWREQNVKKRFIWPGIAAYRIGSTETFNAGEIASQIGITRKTVDPGAIFFSQKSLRNDLGGIQREMTQRVYTTDAVIPHFSWIAAAPMRSPEVKIEREGKYVRASWRERGERRAFWYVVRAKDKDGWSQSVLPASEHAITLSASRQIEKIVVTAVDRLGNESR